MLFLGPRCFWTSLVWMLILDKVCFLVAKVIQESIFQTSGDFLFRNRNEVTTLKLFIFNQCNRNLRRKRKRRRMRERERELKRKTETAAVTQDTEKLPEVRSALCLWCLLFSTWGDLTGQANWEPTKMGRAATVSWSQLHDLSRDVCTWCNPSPEGGSNHHPKPIHLLGLAEDGHGSYSAIRQPLRRYVAIYVCVCAP